MTPPPSWVPTPAQLRAGLPVPARPGVRPRRSLSPSRLLRTASAAFLLLFLLFLALLAASPAPDLSLARVQQLASYSPPSRGVGQGRGWGQATGPASWLRRAQAVFFSSPSGAAREGHGDGRLRALVVTAHPDDEAMFFGPAILAFQAAGWELSALCLSTGNHTGLASSRVPELLSSYSVLGVPSSRIALPPSSEFIDGPSALWPPHRLASAVQTQLDARPADLILTFDALGVSAHPNHIALSSLGAGLGQGAPPVLYLQSPRLRWKYAGWVSAFGDVLRLWAERLGVDVEGELPALGLRKRRPRKPAEELTGPPIVIVSGLRQYLRTLLAMLRHRTQMVWFRWLYVAFSELMWVNRLVPHAQSHP